MLTLRRHLGGTRQARSLRTEGREIRMHRDLMEIIVCPVCKGTLTLTVEREEDGDILEGSLHCDACPETYPITDGIPNLLPPDVRREMEAAAAEDQSS